MARTPSERQPAMGGRRQPLVEAGLLALDKPTGITSHDVVARVRLALGLRRVGHTGTLDPLASGVLVVLLGIATRLSGMLTAHDKEYEGEALLGQATDTYDSEGEPLGAARPAGHIMQDEVTAAAAALSGALLQSPPPFSARKVDGERLYRKARRGEMVAAPPAAVQVSSFTVSLGDAGVLRFSAKVSSGTYIRSLIHDLGKSLGCGAHLTRLRRTAAGPFTVASTLPLQTLVDDPPAALAGPAYLPLDRIPLDLAEVQADAGAILALSQGQTFSGQTNRIHPRDSLDFLQVRGPAGELVALAVADGNGRYRPRAVLIAGRGAGPTGAENRFTASVPDGNLGGSKREE